MKTVTWDDFPDAPAASAATSTASDPWADFPDAAPSRPQRAAPPQRKLKFDPTKTWRFIGNDEAQQAGIAGQGIEADQHGAWYGFDPQTNEIMRAQEEQQNVARSQKAVADNELGSLPEVIRTPLEGIDVGLQRTAAPLVRGLENAGLAPENAADSAVRLANATEANASERTDGSFGAQVVRGAIASITQAAAGSAVAGPAGAVASFAGSAGNEAYTEAKDAGRKDQAMSHAVKSGLIEGAITIAFNRLGKLLPGAGGLESSFNVGTLKGISKETLKRIGTSIAGEELEELSIAALDNFQRQASGINPQEWGSLMQDTFVQTAATMGLINTPAAIRGGAQAWAARHPEQAATLAAIENPSRKDLENAGISGARNTTPQERAELAAALVEPVKKLNPRAVTNSSDIQPGDMLLLKDGNRAMVDSVADGVFNVSGDFGQASVRRKEIAEHQRIRPRQEPPIDTADPASEDFVQPRGGSTATPTRPVAETPQTAVDRRISNQFEPVLDETILDQFPEQGAPPAEAATTPKELERLVRESGATSVDQIAHVQFTGTALTAAGISDKTRNRLVAEGILRRENGGYFVNSTKPNESPDFQEIAPAPKPAVAALDRASVQAALPGQKLVDLPEGDGYRVELENGQWFTLRHVDDVGPVNRAAAERSVGRKLSDEEFANFAGKGSWQVSTADGRTIDGAGLLKLVRGKAGSPTLRHELLHTARSLGLLSDAEWRALVEEHAQGAKTDGDAEERIARGIEKWKGPDGLWAKLVAKLNRLLSALGIVNPTANTATARLVEGKVWSRAAKPETRQDAAARLAGEVRYSGDADARDYAAELANPADDPKARALVDTARIEQGRPEIEPEAQVEAEADALLKKDYAGTRSAVIAATQRVGGLSAVETVAAKRIISRDGLAAVLSGDEKAIADAVELVQAYTRAGTEQARAFRFRQDKHETPTQRRRRFLSEAMLEPPDGLKAKIQAALDAKDEAEAKKLQADWKRKAKQIADDLKSAGLLPDSDQGLQDLLNDTPRFMEALRAVRSRKSSWGDVILEYWYNAILSAIPTHSKNVVGNSVNAVWGGLEGLAKQAIDVGTGKKSAGDVADEHRAFWSALLPSLGAAGRNFATSFKHEYSPLAQQLATDPTSLLEGTEGQTAIGGTTGRIIRLPKRLLAAADEFFKTAAVHSLAVVEAQRVAKSEGLSGAALAKRTAELAADPSGKAWSNAYQTSLEMTFQEQGGAFRKGLKDTIAASRRIPYFGPVLSRFLVPFTNIAINSAAQTAARSPLGLIGITAKAIENVSNGRPALAGMSDLMAKQAIGLIATAMVYAAVGDDEEKAFAITGKDHPDHKYALRIGDTWFPYSGIEPVASFLGLIADGVTSLKAGKGAVAFAGDSLASIGNQIAEKPLLGALSDAAKVVTSDHGFSGESGGERAFQGTLDWAARFGGSWVPALAKQTGRAGRDVEPERRQWGPTGSQEALERLGRRTLARMDIGLVDEAAKFDRWGEKVPATVFKDSPASDFLFRLVSPVKAGTYKPHPGDALIARWNDQLGPDEKPVSPPELDPTFTRGGKSYSMTDEQFARYAELAGQAAAVLFEAGNFDPENPTAEQIRAIERNFEAARTKAKDLIQAEIDGGEPAEVTAETLATEIRRSRVKALRETATSKFTFQKRAGETAEQYRERLGRWKTDKAAAREELNRLLAAK